jgi:hypothetical protein
MISSSDDDDAESAQTSAEIGPGGKTTILPPATHAAVQHAWSQEEPETQPLRQSWGLTWGWAAALGRHQSDRAGSRVRRMGAGADEREHLNAPPAANPPTSWGAPQLPPWMPTTTAQQKTPPTPAKLGIGNLPGTDGLG